MRTLIVLLLVFAAPATAATIIVTPQTGDKPAVVAVEGVLRDEDIADFRFKVAKLSNAVVCGLSTNRPRASCACGAHAAPHLTTQDVWGRRAV
jgi:hypothetical protein